MGISLSTLKRGKEVKPPLILLYGVHGIGKSTWASEAPDPVFIQTEEGLNTLDVVKFPLSKTIDDVYGAIGALVNEDHKFKTCVIDSIDWAEQLVHKAVRQKHGESIFTDYGKGYKFAVPFITNLLDGLTHLRDKKNMMIILLGHAKIFAFNSPEAPAYDRYAPDLHEQVATVCEEWADAVLFANYKVYVTKEDAGFGKQEGKATGKGDRVIYTQERPPYRAKNRYSLPHDLPMNFGAFLRGMSEGLKLTPQGSAAEPAAKEAAQSAQPAA